MDNFRVSVLMDRVIPDFSFFFSLCPPAEDCSGAAMSSLTLCHACYPASFKELLNIEDLFSGGSFNSLVTDWLSSAFWAVGLRLVFQSWRSQRNDTQQLADLIRTFHSVMGPLANGSYSYVDLSTDAVANMNESQLCGYYNHVGRDEKIMGGTPLDSIERHPWQLSLSVRYMGTWYQHRCGSSVITSKWALSAAHCVETYESDLATGYIDSLNLLGGFLSHSDRDLAEIREVAGVIIHQDYDPVFYEQDIALLLVDAPFVFSNRLLPVCLPSPQAEHTGAMGVLTGWGREYASGPLTAQLESVQLPVLSNQECMEWYNSSGSPQWIPEQTFVCAGWKEGRKDACSGDSGGPLTVPRVTDMKIEQIAIVSWGIGCGTARRPGVYTRLSKFIDWIEEEADEENPYMIRLKEL